MDIFIFVMRYCNWYCLIWQSVGSSLSGQRRAPKDNSTGLGVLRSYVGYRVVEVKTCVWHRLDPIHTARITQEGLAWASYDFEIANQSEGPLSP